LVRKSLKTKAERAKDKFMASLGIYKKAPTKTRFSVKHLKKDPWEDCLLFIKNSKNSITIIAIILAVFLSLGFLIVSNDYFKKINFTAMGLLIAMALIILASLIFASTKLIIAKKKRM
jgi:hypothetical protein